MTKRSKAKRRRARQQSRSEESSPTITEQQRTEFLRYGEGCPRCGRDAPVEGAGVEIEGNRALQEVICSDCDMEWQAEYTLDDISGTFSVVQGLVVIPVFGIELLRLKLGDSWRISHNMLEVPHSADIEGEFEDKVQMLENFILHCVEAGVDVTTPGFAQAVRETVEAAASQT